MMKSKSVSDASPPIHLDQAISRYRQRQISMGRAAEDAGISLYEMMDELQRRGISQDQTTPAEAREAIQTLLAEIAHSA